MQWSKMKKQLEERLCDSLKDHIRYQSTRYRGTHDQEGRAWVTYGKEIIYDFCTIRRSYKFNSLAYELRKKTNSLNWRDNKQADGYWEAYRQAEEQMEFEGEYSQYEFYNAVDQYINSPIDEAMLSDDPIIRALSMFDKRLGKRRLGINAIENNEKPIVKLFKTIRMQAEGLVDEVGNIT
ncbi:hypothetical protein D3C81_1204950 [compost metagenome]